MKQFATGFVCHDHLDYRVCGNDWLISPWIHGIRCVVRVNGDDTQCVDNFNRPVRGSAEACGVIARSFPTGMVVDGVFRSDIMCLFAFDLLIDREFDAGFSHRRLSTRLDQLRQYAPSHCSFLRCVHHTPYSHERLLRLRKTSWHSKFVIRRDGGYVGSRTADILIVPRAYADWYSVVECVDDGSVTKVIVNHKGHRVEIPSSCYPFGDIERISVVEVRHLGETSDGTSLVLPCITGVRTAPATGCRLPTVFE